MVVVGEVWFVSSLLEDRLLLAGDMRIRGATFAGGAGEMRIRGGTFGQGALLRDFM